MVDGYILIISLFPTNLLFMFYDDCKDRIHYCPNCDKKSREKKVQTMSIMNIRYIIIIFITLLFLI